MLNMRILLLITVLGLALLFFSSCSDDDPSAPQPETPYRLTAPLQNAVVDVPLTANQPTNVKLTLHLPPEFLSSPRPRSTSPEPSTTCLSMAFPCGH